MQMPKQQQAETSWTAPAPTKIRVKHSTPQSTKPPVLGDEWERVPEDDPSVIIANQEVVDHRLDALEGQIVDLYKRLGFKKKSKLTRGQKSFIIDPAPQGD